jgi:hypothetical protein
LLITHKHCEQRTSPLDLTVSAMPLPRAQRPPTSAKTEVSLLQGVLPTVLENPMTKIIWDENPLCLPAPHNDIPNANVLLFATEILLHLMLVCPFGSSRSKYERCHPSC